MKHARINFRFRKAGRAEKVAKYKRLAARGRELKLLAGRSCINGQEHAWEEDGQTLLAYRWHCPKCNARKVG